jgi:hypothetical protein
MSLWLIPLIVRKMSSKRVDTSYYEELSNPDNRWRNDRARSAHGGELRSKRVAFQSEGTASGVIKVKVSRRKLARIASDISAAAEPKGKTVIHRQVSGVKWCNWTESGCSSAHKVRNVTRTPRTSKDFTQNQQKCDRFWIIFSRKGFASPIKSSK